MNWTSIVNFLGGTTLFLTAVGFIVKSVTKHFLDRDLEKMKGEIKDESDRALLELRGGQERELQRLREAQEGKMEQLRQTHETALQNIQNQANERIESFKSTLQRVERLENDLLKSRDDAYGEIWKLTGALNLFGPADPVDCGKLSTQLTQWYFSKGRLLTSESKPRYFLLQEVLNFLQLHSIPLQRPSGELLFSSDKRTIDALRSCRATHLQIAAKSDEANYTLPELATCVTNCKARFAHPAEASVFPEDAWLLLQFVMSAFRSCLVQELGSRDVVHSSLAAEESRVGSSRLPVGNGAPVVSSLGAQHAG